VPIVVRARNEMCAGTSPQLEIKRAYVELDRRCAATNTQRYLFALQPVSEAAKNLNFHRSEHIMHIWYTPLSARIWKTRYAS
jgi:hypothetical protein